MYKYKKLGSTDFDAVVKVIRQRFGDDSCLVDGVLTDDFVLCVQYCLDRGLSLGVAGIDGTLVGFALVVDYSKLPEDVFSKLFCCSGYSDAPNHGLIHGAIRSLSNVLYVVSLVTLGSAVGATDVLVDGLVSEYSAYAIVADTVDRFAVQSYIKHGFKCVSIGFGHWYASLKPSG